MKPKIMVLLGSTREGRLGAKVFEWVKTKLVDNSDVEYTFIDLKDWDLAFYNESLPASMLNETNYSDPRAKQWADKVASFDGYLILTPEYNHGYPAVLKNALDLTYTAWNNKPVGFVAWGSALGARAVEQLRQVAVELQMAPIREWVGIAAFAGGVDQNGVPTEDNSPKLQKTVDQLIWWTKALKTARGA